MIADSFVGLFIGWELVGACSYLLIGFWFRKAVGCRRSGQGVPHDARRRRGAARGSGVLWWATGSLAYQDVVARIEPMPPGLLQAAAVCIAIGAMGKSAQFPLHAWLPDAMEGPTPVSALDPCRHYGRCGCIPDSPRVADLRAGPWRARSWCWPPV